MRGIFFYFLIGLCHKCGEEIYLYIDFICIICIDIYSTTY